MSTPKAYQSYRALSGPVYSGNTNSSTANRRAKAARVEAEKAQNACILLPYHNEHFWRLQGPEACEAEMVRRLGEWLNRRAQAVAAVSLLLLLFALPAFAQSPPVTVDALVPLTVYADHDGVNTDSYPLIVDGKEVMDVPASMRDSTRGTVQFLVASGFLTPGNHIIVACAKNSAGRGCSLELQVVAVLKPPTPPSQPRLVLELPNGQKFVVPLVPVQ